MLKLTITENIFEEILQQARSEAPIEACGILAGKNSHVEKLYRMKNADQSGDHFMMSPEEQFKVAKDIRSSELEMLAIYHSHPETPARPSQEDIRLALTPDVVYVIVSLKDKNNPMLKGFQIENGKLEETPVQIIKNSN